MHDRNEEKRRQEEALNQSQQDQVSGDENEGDPVEGGMFAKLSESTLDRDGSNNNLSGLNEDSNDDAMNELIENFLFYGITCCFLTLSFMIAMTVSDLGVVLGVVGATGSTMVSYILPGAIYIKIHPEPHPLRSLACIQLILGILIVPIALYFVLFKGGGG